jgi:hypothetical protein
MKRLKLKTSPSSCGLASLQHPDANAGLIAAAPDLLAALADIVKLADTSDFYLPRNWLADARAAISKAEGRG